VVALALSYVPAALAADNMVVVPEDNKPFKVNDGDIVRLTGKGIAGATIDVKVVEGPAKLKATNDISTRKNGHPLIGSSVKEFELLSTGKGKVKVKITVKNPTSPNPIVTEYSYEVE
jgi:hypothetical protein